jgi:hypothetical protein
MPAISWTSSSFLISGVAILLCSAPLLGQKSKSRKPKPVELVAQVEPQAVEKNWKLFTSTTGKFSVVSPGELTYQQKTAQTPEGPVQLHVFYYFANAEYSVSYADYLLMLQGSDRLTAFLNTVRDAGVKGINGRLLEDKEITLSGYPGRSYIVEYGTNHGFLLMGRNIVVGQRLYMITASYGKNEVPLVEGSYEKWARRFLDSFTLNATSN